MYEGTPQIQLDDDLPALERETVVIKFVVTGPFAAGKTTLVKTMSEIPVIGTETSVTDETSSIKPNTTVSMDFGKLTLVDEDMIVELSLFGTPGQQRFNFMWDVLAEGMDGYLVLVDLSRRDSFEEAAGIIAHFDRISDVPFIIGANKGNGADRELDGIAETLGARGAQVVACDATDQESARDTLLALLLAVLSAVDEDVEP
ncbi:MAG TPA: ATP/GTP-binding protein [Solirubrobacteraceae bacterium]|jgi:signal recognition particle receptor subunit beta|nr:ATP/GTP-binding protein [Solirubrobacteraceae bacterium]